MRVLSLFDGMSCGMIAMKISGQTIDRYVAYEIDKYAVQTSSYNFPMIEHKGDVFAAEYQEGEFDILIGGSPCTYWSIAGARKDGNRETKPSGLGYDLFMQYVRVLREAKPKYFLYENNDSMSEAISDAITKELGVDYIMIDSADFSAQRRRRRYWTNIPVDMNYKKSDVLFSDIQFVADCQGSDFGKYADTKRVSEDGLCISWDSSGKGNYSQQNRARKPEQKWNTLPSSGNDKNNVFLGGTKFRRIHPVEAERLQTLPDNYTDCLKSNVKRVEVCGNGLTVDVIAHILKGLM